MFATKVKVAKLVNPLNHYKFTVNAPNYKIFGVSLQLIGGIMTDHKDIFPSYYMFRHERCHVLQEGFQFDDREIDISSYYEQQILKYLYRYPKKGRREDLIKARTYLNKLINLFDDEENLDYSPEGLNDV